MGMEVNFGRPHACQARLLHFTLVWRGFFRVETIGEPAEFQRTDALPMRAHAHPAASIFMRLLQHC